MKRKNKIALEEVDPKCWLDANGKKAVGCFMLESKSVENDISERYGGLILSRSLDYLADL